MKIAIKPAIILGLCMLLLVSLLLGQWFAPLSMTLGFDPTYLLSWGAPAVFYDGFGNRGLSAQVEPWRLLGLQLPAFAALELPEEVPVIEPSPLEPVSPGLNQPTDPEAPAIKVDGLVGIYHSHTTESFISTAGVTHTENFDKTVVRLGMVIADSLTARGIDVVHDRTYHDQIYSESYRRSAETLKKMKASHPGFNLIMDVHRDSVRSNPRGATTARINGREAGMIMFIVGSRHQNWRENYRVAMSLDAIIEEMYPGLTRGVRVYSFATYNQDLHPQSILVEIGGDHNTLEEAMYGAELFADAVAVYLEGLNPER